MDCAIVCQLSCYSEACLLFADNGLGRHMLYLQTDLTCTVHKCNISCHDSWVHLGIAVSICIVRSHHVSVNTSFNLQL